MIDYVRFYACLIIYIKYKIFNTCSNTHLFSHTHVFGVMKHDVMTVMLQNEEWYDSICRDDIVNGTIG